MGDSLECIIGRIDQRTKDTQTDVKEIKDSIKDYPATKEAVSWLKGWHNKIVGGLILAGLGAVGSIVAFLLTRGHP